MNSKFKDPKDITISVSGRKARKGSWVSIGKKYIYIARKGSRSYWAGPSASKLKFSDRNHSARIGSNLIKFKTDGKYQKAKRIFSGRSNIRKTSKRSHKRSYAKRGSKRSKRSKRRSNRRRSFGKGAVV